MSRTEQVPLAKEIDDVQEASMESFPASDAPASRHGSVIPDDQSAQPDFSRLSHPEETDDADEAFWRSAIHQHNFYRPDVGFDRYRWALRLGRLARKHHQGEVSFAASVADLEKAWTAHGGPSGLSWEEARDAVHASWERTQTLEAEAIASRARFKEPPTFSDQGAGVPRNVDEPNM